MHAVKPLVVDCVLIYFNPTPGFSGRCGRCLKFNKAFHVSAVILCLRSVHGLPQGWSLSREALTATLAHACNLSHQVCICLYFASEFFHLR